MPVTGQATTEKQPKVSKKQSKEESMLANLIIGIKIICIGIPVTPKMTAEEQPKIFTAKSMLKRRCMIKSHAQ